MGSIVFQRRYPIYATTVKPYSEPDWNTPPEPYCRTVTIEVEHYADAFGKYEYSEYSRKVDGVVVSTWREDKARGGRSAWAA